MTHRLYYDDPYLREFDAAVVRVEPRGDARAVWLDRSAFYPTSGGQSFDTGTLATLAVVDVIDEEGDVVHLVRGDEELRAGASVHGAIDWPRRFDHMQHHTGQHVLSAAFVRRCQVPTVSFHLGADAVTIDLAREVSAAEIAAAEDEANRVVWENRPVTIRYASAEEAATAGLRKPSTRVGTLRLVEIEDFDRSACGGSHVRQTGAIGVIVVRAAERVKGGHRLEFLCGGRAVRAYRELRDCAAAAVRLTSVLPAELPTAIERLQADLREQERTIRTLRGALAVHEADALAASADVHGGLGRVLHAAEGDAEALKALALAIVSRPGMIAVLASPAPPALIVAARSNDVALACDGLVKALVAAFGGRGGGRPDLAQAGRLDAPGEAILARARTLLP